MGMPANMTNKQLRMISKIEKLLFEKKNYPFEKILKMAKTRCYYNYQGGDKLHN